MTNKKFNCPNCGAPIQNEKCSYCGTVIYDFSAIKLYEINYIKLLIDDRAVIFKAYLDGVQIEQSPQSLPCLNMDFKVVSGIDA